MIGEPGAEKTSKITFSNYFFCSFKFSQPPLNKSISSFLHVFRHLETQVRVSTKGTLEKLKSLNLESICHSILSHPILIIDVFPVFRVIIPYFSDTPINTFCISGFLTPFYAHCQNAYSTWHIQIFCLLWSSIHWLLVVQISTCAWGPSFPNLLEWL